MPKIKVEYLSRINTVCMDLHAISKKQRFTPCQETNAQPSPAGTKKQHPEPWAQKKPNSPHRSARKVLATRGGFTEVSWAKKGSRRDF